MHVVYFVTLILNVFPNRNKVSEHPSPQTIVSGKHFDMKNMTYTMFEKYVEASTNADITNAIQLRTHMCLVIGPARNLQISLKCFDLATGKVIVWRTFKVIPMPDKVIKKVNKWGSTQKALPYGNKLEFLSHIKAKLNWENDDLDVEELVGEEKIYSEIPMGIQGVSLESNFEDVNGPVVILPSSPSDIDRARSARANAGIGKVKRGA